MGFKQSQFDIDNLYIALEGFNIFLQSFRGTKVPKTFSSFLLDCLLMSLSGSFLELFTFFLFRMNEELSLHYFCSQSRNFFLPFVNIRSTLLDSFTRVGFLGFHCLYF